MKQQSEFNYIFGDKLNSDFNAIVSPSHPFSERDVDLMRQHEPVTVPPDPEDYADYQDMVDE